MIEISDNPREMGVEHDEWRPNQLAMLRKVLESEQEFVFGELATGSGKSAVATALGHNEKVLVCVHTLALLTQYEERYGFDVIRGKPEYKCVFEPKVRKWGAFGEPPTAADCTYQPMTKCSVFKQCPYQLAKLKAFASQRAACTYRYAALSSMAQTRSGYLIFDEAHDSVEELISFNKFEYAYKYISSYNLPPFPILEYGEQNVGDILNDETIEIIVEWVNRCANKMVSKTRSDTRRGSKTKRLYDGLLRMATQIRKGEWYLKIEDKWFWIQALRADIIAKRIFGNKKRKLFMSATIGNPQPLAEALGIEEYESFTFPHPIPIKNRPIDRLEVPRMTHKNLSRNKAIYKFQVDRAWEWIEMFDPAWRGVVLTTSYKKIMEFYGHMKRHTGSRRLIVQEKGMKVGDVVEKFITDVRDGDIMIGTVQGMGTGIDLYGNLARWAIIGGVPHVNPRDHYMKVRRQMMGGQKYQHWITYNAVTQAAGRISRGTVNGNGEYITNYVAIADDSAMTKTALKYYPEWFKEAIA